MTEENKKLLFFDLSTRVLYNPKIRLSLDIHQVDDLGEETVEHHEENSTLIGTIHLCDGFIVLNESHNWFNIEEVKPYLRPMSSMTEEERKEWYNVICKSQECSIENSETSTTYVNDWLLKHHFDVRGLIKRELALEAPKDMYNNNK